MGAAHLQKLAHRYGFYCQKISIGEFHVSVVSESVMDLSSFQLQSFSFILGQIEAHPYGWDRFLRINIDKGRLAVENDYAGSIPVFYSQRGGLSLSNIEPCVYLATGSSFNDFSYENMYGFLRYSHFIWEETAWNHINQVLPDSRYIFLSNGKLLSDEYLATVKSSKSRSAYSNKQVADELFQLNCHLVRRSLEDAENIILPLSSGYDSRMIYSVLANDPVLRKKTQCFTYGGAGSIEVEGSRRLAQLKGVDWRHVELPCKFLSLDRLENIADIFGASLHMHGMYQMEFFDEIRKHHVLPRSARLTSGFMTGVPAGQHNGLLGISRADTRLSDAMNRFSQSKVWLEADLARMPVFAGKDYQELAESRFRKAFDRFDGEVHQKAVMFDIWTRQRNFVSYYPRVFEWLCPVASPHMCTEYANFFMSLNKEHLRDRRAVELMFLSHYPDIAKVASNSNGIKSMGSHFEISMFIVSEMLRRLGLPNPLPLRYRNTPIEFDLQSVRHSREESVYPLLVEQPDVEAFLQGFGGRSIFSDLYSQAVNGDSRAYARLVTFQAVPFNGLLALKDIA